ncbi:hypothetical protein SNEBB_000952 [Seison nebaliae]|nr:hypothetical protein SNEBB_000952 [Seison nebaliae]
MLHLIIRIIIILLLTELSIERSASSFLPLSLSAGGLLFRQRCTKSSCSPASTKQRSIYRQQKQNVRNFHKQYLVPSLPTRHPHLNETEQKDNVSSFPTPFKLYDDERRKRRLRNSKRRKYLKRNRQSHSSQHNCLARRPHATEYRTCMKVCRSDKDCVSSVRRCMCDGDCGMSCVNTKMRCEKPRPILNGTIIYLGSSTEHSLFSKILYECHPGFIMTDISIPPSQHYTSTITRRLNEEMPITKILRYCEGDGWWSGPTPTCIKSDNCQKGTLPKLEHANPVESSNSPFPSSEMKKTNFLIRENILFKCHRGYETIGAKRNFQMICGLNGKWISNTNCRPISCKKDDEIENVEMLEIKMKNDKKMENDRSVDQLHFGTIITYKCKSNYYRVRGDVQRTCLTTGKWNKSPLICKIITCGQLKDIPTNSYIRYSSPAIRRRKVIHRRSRPFPMRRKKRLNEGSKWPNRFIRMRRRRRRRRFFENEYGYKIGTRLIINCKKEFESTSIDIYESEAECRDVNGIGRWVGNHEKFRCTKRQCDFTTKLLNRNHIRIQSGLKGRIGPSYIFRENEMIVIGCENANSRFINYSTSTLTLTYRCQKNGTWSNNNNLPICQNVCSFSSLITSANSTGLLSFIRYGMFMNGNVHQKYLVNMLSEKNRLKLVEEKASIGETIHLQCQNKYKEKIEHALSCMRDGKWGPDVICKPSKCTRKPPVVKASQTVFRKRNNGSILYYTCLTGYRLKGNNRVRCVNGAWSGRLPTCEPIYCTHPGTLHNGTIFLVGHFGEYEYHHNVKNEKHDRQIIYRCNKGFRLIGTSAATCLNGEWKPKERPKCVQDYHPLIWLQKHRY